jgi:hypothetical protein
MTSSHHNWDISVSSLTIKAHRVTTRKARELREKF